ncbi:MAG: hypothetical protein WCX73_00400 [Candidatus Pacearchaeota archaeon]|jgi:hypothetical protein
MNQTTTKTKISKTKLLEELLGHFGIGEVHIKQVYNFLNLQKDSKYTPQVSISHCDSGTDEIGTSIYMYVKLPKNKWFKDKREFKLYVLSHNLPDQKIYLDNNRASCGPSTFGGVHGEFSKS